MINEPQTNQFYRSKLSPTKNIMLLNRCAYQVRVVRRGVEKNKLFSFKQWGGQGRALAAAISWRNQIKTVSKCKTKRMIKKNSTNKSTGVTGVSRTQSLDKRTNATYLFYHVNWVDTAGKNRIRSFRVGNIQRYENSIDELAFEMAKKFRTEWELHADNDSLGQFDQTKYSQWRHNSL